MADSLTIDQKYGFFLPDALPPILLVDAREAAAKIARFMTENCDDLGADVEFMFDKKIAAVLNKMMV